MSKNFSSSFRLIPWWAQALIGLALIGLVIFLASKASFYSSEWHERNSNFVKNANDALTHSNIHVYQGPIPTLIYFWEINCESCKQTLKFLRNFKKAEIKLVGIHTKAQMDDKIKAREYWLKHAPRLSPLYFDDTQMLENTFLIRGVPTSFINFPLQDKIFSHVGDVKWSQPRLDVLIRNERDN